MENHRQQVLDADRPILVDIFRLEAAAELLRADIDRRHRIGIGAIDDPPGRIATLIKAVANDQRVVTGIDGRTVRRE
jgi:hypothetical protein